MHSRTLYYTDDDTKYAEDKEQTYIVFHYNSDLSGEVIIQSEKVEIRIPGWMLLEFVGTYVGNEMIDLFEGMDGREVFKFLGGQGVE